MAKLDNLTGRTFSRLTVISRAPNRGGKPAWNCVCSCGNKTIVRAQSLRRDNGTKSCGCIVSEAATTRNKTHGMRYTKTYSSWVSMRDRCNNVNSKDFKNYQARGISIHARWNNFETFYADMGTCPEGHTLDRIDNDGNYEPDNCRWATPKQQANNTRVNRLITFNKKTMTLSQWAELLNVRRGLLHDRLHAGWSIKKAFEVKK